MNTDKIYAEAIANEYAPKETSKVKALKRLDIKAKSPANIFAYTFGVAMSLVLGVGMCFVMILPLIWGLDGIWYSIVVAEFMAVVVTLLFLVFKHKKFGYW